MFDINPTAKALNWGPWALFWCPNAERDYYPTAALMSFWLMNFVPVKWFVTHPIQDMMIEKSFSKNHQRFQELWGNQRHQLTSSFRFHGDWLRKLRNSENSGTVKNANRKVFDEFHRPKKNYAHSYPKTDLESSATRVRSDRGLVGKSNPGSQWCLCPTSSGKPPRLWPNRIQGTVSKPRRNTSAQRQTR